MYPKILVPVDDSPTSDAGLNEAIRLGKLCGSQLRLIHIVEKLPYFAETAVYEIDPKALVTDIAAEAELLLARLADRVRAEGLGVDTRLVASGGHQVDAYVNEQAKAWPADLVVLGTHGRRGVERILGGSVAEQVVRHADMPVLLVRQPYADEGGRGDLQSIAAAIA